MRRDHSTSPFDAEAEEAGDVTQQFWGSSRGWESHRATTTTGPAGDASQEMWDADRLGDDTTGSLQAIRQGVRAFRPRRLARARPTGQVERTRQHGVVGHGQAPRAPEASLGELAAGGFHGDHDREAVLAVGQQTRPMPAIDAEHDLVQLSAAHPSSDRIGLGGVDPLLARIGMIVLIVLLLVPVALALRPSSDRVLTETLTAGVVPNVAALDDVSDAAAPQPTEPQTSQTPAAAPAAAPADAPNSMAASSEPVDVVAIADESTSQPQSTEAATPSSAVDDVVEVKTSSAVRAATVSAAAERTVPACPTSYVAGAGDSWYRIADAAGVTPNALLDENRATVNTVILPGDEICLPAGATMPTQPTTTTAAPTTTQAPTTTAPATTQPPSTTPATPSEVQQIIRDVWPDELEEKALQIAWRESNYIATVYNGWCCYGVFQIYWSVHVSWLDEYGIYSSADLLDARKNITAAYALYQRAGGWGPWGG